MGAPAHVENRLTAPLFCYGSAGDCKLQAPWEWHDGCAVAERRETVALRPTDAMDFLSELWLYMRVRKKYWLGSGLIT